MTAILKCFSGFSSRFKPSFSARFIKLRRKKIPLPEEIKFKSQEDSLKTRGFLRNYKPYVPPEDAGERVAEICAKFGIENDPDRVIEDATVRFSILKECFKEFEHGVPNSALHTVETTGQIKTFYETPVDTTVPYDAFKNMDLPPNLHIQYDYVRFQPDDSTIYGKTAFPGSSTLVTGLKARKKYQGHTARSPWENRNL